MINQALKIELHHQCVAIINQQLIDLKQAIAEAQDAANNETKSSAGDKHETGRAMAQLETEQLSAQLAEVIHTSSVLEKIDPSLKQTIGSLGSIIQTNNGIFYLAVGLGKVEMANDTIFVISTQSPIGKLLLTKKEKESFSFNGNNYVIECVF